MTGEFELISRYFAPLEQPQAWLQSRIGDDCALIAPPAGKELVFSVDIANAGVHFPADADGSLVAARSLGSALSDLAAAGATPLAFTLALSLPAVDHSWLQGFAARIAGIADRTAITLIGGDTTKGPLAVTVQVIGTVPKGKALKRSGAAADELLWVSGNLGEAAAGLAVICERYPHCNRDTAARLSDRYRSPQPRLSLGQGLLGIATAAIDISDGLLADAGHLAVASGVEILLQVDEVPLAEDLIALAGRRQALEWALGGGDDYELCFTAPAEDRPHLHSLGCSIIGEVRALAPGQSPGIIAPGAPEGCSGWEHFRDE